MPSVGRLANNADASDWRETAAFSPERRQFVRDGLRDGEQQLEVLAVR
jgi:hypothetical protein